MRNNKIILIFFEIILLKYFINIKNKFLILNNYFIYNKYNIIKKVLLSRISKYNKKKINNISILFIRGKGRFGNYYISINNAIIYCQFLGCKKIIIEYSNEILINKIIFYKKYNLKIEPNQTINYMEKNLVILSQRFLMHNNFKFIRNANKFNIFKRQLLNNLPKIVTHPDDLYIYIRGGDIFNKNKKTIKKYPQPPLCFYMKILDKFKFREIIIISEDKLNPVIPKLLHKYSNIKYTRNNLKIDISYLSNSYNIVAGKSSFLTTAIKFNDKLKFLWEYDFYLLSERYLHLHYSVYKFPFHYTIYKMNSSKIYRRLMYPWHNSVNQRNIMLNKKCENNFYIIRERMIID